jgi:hypothetical protein
MMECVGGPADGDRYEIAVGFAEMHVNVPMPFPNFGIAKVLYIESDCPSIDGAAVFVPAD